MTGLVGLQVQAQGLPLLLAHPLHPLCLQQRLQPMRAAAVLLPG